MLTGVETEIQAGLVVTSPIDTIVSTTTPLLRTSIHHENAVGAGANRNARRSSSKTMHNRPMPDGHNIQEERFLVSPPPHLPQPIALGIWILIDARRRTLNYLRKIHQATIDYQPRTGAGTIGSLLYHLSATEMEWLHEDILQTSLPAAVQTLLPHPDVGEDGRLAVVVGATPDDHRARLTAVQVIFIDALTAMDEAAYQRSRKGPSGTFSAEWIVYHLAQHEAHHRGQIAMIRKETEALNSRS